MIALTLIHPQNYAAVTHLFQHWGDMLTGAVTGATGMSIIGYALRTFPPPQNKYAIWLLKVAQTAASNTDKVQELRDADQAKAVEQIPIHFRDRVAAADSTTKATMPIPANPASLGASASGSGTSPLPGQANASQNVAQPAPQDLID
jgi:hypothetical protein